jgi:hypothetical protein
MISHGHLDDASIDDLAPEWDDDPLSFMLRVRAPADAPFAVSIIRNATSFRDLDDLCFLSAGLIEGGRRATDSGGFAPDGGSIVVWDAGDNEVTVSLAAFSRLMIRLLETAREHTDPSRRDELGELVEGISRSGR